MDNIQSHKWLILRRIVRFGDTDAAGIMHFYQLFRWCHEAWEESLEICGIPSSDVFPKSSNDKEIILPIVQCKADFRAPIQAGDELRVRLFPEKLNISSFQISTHFQCHDQNVALAMIRHVAINANTRKRCPLPENIERWIESSSVNCVINPMS